MSDLTLYQVKDDFITLFEKRESEEITEEEYQAKGKELAITLKNKGQNIIAYNQNLEKLSENIKNEIDRLTVFKKAIENKQDKFKEYVKRNMEDLGIEKLETPLGILSIVKNPPSVEILSEEDVPNEFKKEKLTVTVDKTAIKKHFSETGEIIPGTTVITDKRSLRIK